MNALSKALLSVSCIPCIRTHRCADPVGFGINEASDLGEVAVALCGKLDSCRLHEEGVV